VKKRELVKSGDQQQKKIEKGKIFSKQPAHCLSTITSIHINIIVAKFIWNELLRTYLCDRFLKE